MSTPNIRVVKKRKFIPIHLLQTSAACAFDDAVSKRDGYYYDQLNCILHCALTLEAIGNSFGEILFESWGDYENLRPLSKLRLIAEHLEIPFDKNLEPWQTAVWLIQFRNRLVHPRIEDIVSDELMSFEEREKSRFEKPQSKIEKEITEVNMKRCYSGVEEILDTLTNALPINIKGDVISDGWTGHASHENPKSNEPDENAE